MRPVRSHLLLQIVYPDGETFRMRAGSPLELDLESKLADALLSEVGKVATRGQIEKIFHKVFRQVMFDFKDQTRTQIEPLL